MEEQREGVSRILKVINDVEKECDHADLEITVAGDVDRYFVCSVCGRHRSESRRCSNEENH